MFEIILFCRESGQNKYKIRKIKSARKLVRILQANDILNNVKLTYS